MNCNKHFLRGMLLTCVSFFLISQTYLLAQSGNTTGKVTDENGTPISNATVQVKGGTTKAITKTDGTFSIQATTGSTLVVGSVGFLSIEVTVTGSSLLLALKPNANDLQDVIVVGYGTRRKGDVTGSVASVNQDKLREVPTTNVTQALQGRIPGLVATPSSFAPGSGATIRIRGNRSLVATNDPLVVLDGVPIAYSINDINPLDIESIDVLKDASATAIYGSRGANGVIQVTTKKGKTGKISVEYDGKVSFDNIIRPLEVFSAAEYAQLRRDAYFGNKAYNLALSPGTGTNTSLYYPDPRVDSILFLARQDYYTWQSVADGYTWIDRSRFIAAKRATTTEEKAMMANLGVSVLDSIAIYDPSKIKGYDWQKNGLQTGITNNHNITVTGGSEKFRASFSAGYFGQKGIQVGQDFNRYSFSLNTDIRPNKVVNFGGGIIYSTSIQNTGPNVYGVASNMLPIARPYDTSGTFILNPGNDANIVNPLNDANTVFNETRVNRAIPNMFAEIQVIKGLKLRAAGNIDASNVRIGTFNGSVSSVRAGGTANASYTARSYFSWSVQNLLTYDTRIKNKHSINALIGQEFVQSRFEENYSAADQLIYETQKWYSLQNNAATTPTQTTGTFTKTKNWSAFGRLNYGFMDRYLLTFTVRDDWSSVLPASRQHQVFPSGAFSWRIDKESFMRDVSFVNSLKLRIGYGEVGNAGIDPYRSSGTLIRTPYNYGGTAAQGYAPSTLPLDITWERTKSKSAGLDFTLFNNRINGTIEYYQTNSNQILSKRLPTTSGFSSVLVNVGDVRNRGIDISLSTINIANPKGITWTTDFIFGINKESIVSLDTKQDNISSQWFIGQPLSVYYDYKFQRIFQYSDTAKGGILADYFWKKAGNKTNTSYQPGRPYVADINGDTSITETDKQVLGSHNPKWTGSISSTLTYKNFELNILVYTRQGSLIREMRPSLNGRYQSFKVNYWTPSNPSNEYAQANNTIDIQQYWQAMGFRSGSFVRVRNISLTYRFPQPLLDKWKVARLNVYVNVLNPFLFSSYKTADPETIPYLSSYPSSSTSGPGPNSFNYRSVVVGVRLGL
ncbi:TonB-linked outer membrane protein, SusC/RagA family [Filimonas lacunae]|uniref:TonB-linked outer membrane protein, SusC/RagA family n=1 Tax=Filimonas lacunae TaxID=477680 RepID=A0A173MFJ3_9BACT|nr:TonB-dependent receptor [Filimonas lacunae]BAV06382.1 outer membrane protein, nutrient binding [Filimonas lacunae]SIT26723.1 TonB-linked outer membrane protein, SusC/RagA family [Filimonas lacunae]